MKNIDAHLMMRPITDDSTQSDDYNKALDCCRSLTELREMVKSYKEIAPDALDQLPKNADEFLTFRMALSKVRRGKWPGNLFFQKHALLMRPILISKVAVVAKENNVSWGYAYRHLRKQPRR